MALRSGPSLAAENLVMQKAVEVLGAGSTISMEKLREHIADANKRSALADKILSQGGIQMDKKDVVEALRSQLMTTEQVLQHKESFLGEAWNVVIWPVKKVTGFIKDHPWLSTAVVAALAYWFLGNRAQDMNDFIENAGGQAREVGGGINAATRTSGTTGPGSAIGSPGIGSLPNQAPTGPSGRIIIPD